MSNNKQSSVEQLEFDLKLWFDIMKIYFPTEIQNSINRSKAMHKQEIIAAKDDNYVYGEAWEKLGTLGEQYYNETFGDNK